MAIRKALRFQILNRDHFTCLYCGHAAPEVALEVDHVTPASLGGEDVPWNLVTACQSCNAGKRDLEMSKLPEAVVRALSHDLGFHVAGVWFGRMGDAPRNAEHGYLMFAPSRHQAVWYYHSRKRMWLDDFDAAASWTRTFVEQSPDAGPEEAWDYFLEMCERRAGQMACNRQNRAN